MMTNYSGPQRKWLPRLLLVAVASIGLLAAACGAPSSERNSLVVYVAVDDCASDEITLLAGAPSNNWEKLENTGLCGAAPADRSWSGQKMQVWRTPTYSWRSHGSKRLQLGQRLSDETGWVVTPSDWLRIDYHHLLLGVVAVVDGPAYVPASQVTSMAEPLKERQDCEDQNPNTSSCGREWRTANLLTFEVTS